MLSDISENYRIILASRSPRRQQLLRELGLEFKVCEKEYDESYPEGLMGEEIALYLARSKADHFRDDLHPGDMFITADTIVCCNGKLLEKPSDRQDALRMLRLISGNTHEVITGVNILTLSKETTFTDTTKVTFENLSDEEIIYYIDRFRPYDKAGGYGIQEWIGIAGCSRLEGSYFNVVGLPAQRLYKELKNF
ncbi:MAG TPA: Maf family nucleotide pyrophosphatase [Bacteroidales bacterium]|nr:Maf family nucleotide pyrophosphatase [Bacteroidales bacterium]HPR11122.1 Maf family nucleotide pyrophosphatase [Bacteroidales bacterium]HRW84778.1 Maf family nucleotide pyrophosphatase [Bacteroidales bacterium]